MKKIFLPLLVSVLVLSLAAQTKSGYVPFHQYFLNNHGDIQKSQGNARNVAFEEIAYMHYAPTSAGGWIYADSGQFFFGQVTPGVSPMYEDSGSYYQFGSVSWANSARFTNSVNGLGLYTSSQWQAYDTASKVWNNSYLFNYTYNGINYLATENINSYSTGSSVDSVQYTYTYNTNNYDSITVVQKGASLQNDTQYLYTHNGYLTTGIITQVWSGSAWTNLYKQTNNFDANGNNYQSFVSVWNGTGWNNYALIISGYDLNNELVSYVYELWNAGSGTYVNNYQEAYAWVLGNNTQFENYDWDSTSNSWTPNSLNTYSYDGNHNVIFESDLSYSNGAFANAAQYYYYYNAFTVSGIKDLSGNLNVDLYPNPSNGNAVINFTTQTAGSTLLNIYDALGNQLNQQKVSISAGANQIPVNLSAYAAGNYFVKLVDVATGNSSVLKMVKQ